MTEWEHYAWVEVVEAATIAVIAHAAPSAHALLGSLGSIEDRGTMSFDTALDLQGAFYDETGFPLYDHADFEPAIFQAERLADGEPWVTVEPNGYQLSTSSRLELLAAGGSAVSFFWNVNWVMSFVHVDRGNVLAEFDPLVDFDQAPEAGRDLPFEQSAHVASLALIERLTGIVIRERWFAGAKPTYIVRV